MELLIGDRAWSSWSMRAWLVLRRAGADFRTTAVALRRPQTRAEILREGSPSGRVPALKLDDGVVVWDSLAICEWAAEQHPQARLWPADASARARARAATAEMHAGFPAIRTEFPMDLDGYDPREASAAAAAELRRLVELWTGLRAVHGAGGDFLFGGWTIADAFFTPVATRLRTYVVDLAPHGDAGAAADYAAALLATPEVREWEAG